MFAEPNSFLLRVSVTSISFNSHLFLLWVPFQCCISRLHYLQTGRCFGSSFPNCKWLVLQSKEENFFAVFSPSSLTPRDCDDGGGGSHEQAGAGCCWGCWGGTGWQWLVKLAHDHQDQAADLGQICSWAVTQPGVQLAMAFAASF